MKDEFRFLRPLILFSAGFLVLGIVLHACREAAEQRARFGECPSIGACSAGGASGPVTRSGAAFRVFPPTSLPGGTFEVTSPAD
jgi:hypothetical protein